MTVPLELPVLAGRLVRLEPITPEHVPGLVAASAQSRDMYRYATVPDGHDAFIEYLLALQTRRSAGEMIPLALVRVADDHVVGATRFLSFRTRADETHPYAVEIGGTWLATFAQRTGINVEAKFLQLRHAFERWGVSRVDFKTDARNDSARKSLLALGAQFEGILRNWQPSQVPGEQHTLRDTAMYSILGSEWPGARWTSASGAPRPSRPPWPAAT